MPNTNKMIWPVPAKDSDPWFEIFDQMVTAQDSSSYAHREDRHNRLSGGGDVSFNATSGVVAWTAPIEILSPISGFKITVPVPLTSLVVEDGQLVYINLTRSPVSNVSAVAVVASTAPNTDSAYVLCVRNGTGVFWVNGTSVLDGESKSLFGGPGAGTQIEIVNLANRTSNGSVTPLVAGGAAFNPALHDKPGFTKLMQFRAVSANGETGITTSVTLWNVTDGEEVAALSFTTTAQAKDEVVLVEGAGAGEVDSVEKIYEVRIFLDASPGGPTETVELYEAEIRVTSTPV